MDVFSDSEESCPESSDTDDHDGIGSAYSGNAQGILSSLNESIGNIDDFLAFQRGFAHGDVVYSIIDPSKQFGRVGEVSMVVDLETSMGELIEGVDSRKLVKLHPFSLGDFVLYGSWLGRVSRVFDQVSVLLNNGSICDMIVEDQDDVVPLTPSLFVDDSHLFYYPGQRVSIKHHSPETTKWLCGSWKVGRAEGTVFHVNVGLVNVEWIKSLSPLGCTQSPPGHLQDPSMLTLLSCFSHANWQIGDCCLLRSDCDCLYKTSEKESVQPIVTPHFMMIEHLQETEVPKALYSIAKIKIKVDVFWQNGLVSVGLDPEDLHLVSNIGEHDFWPGQFVMEKVIEGDVRMSNARHLGVVKAVDPQEQIVKVKWFSLKQFVQADWEIQEEVVSAYELVEHPDASFSLGDIVIQFPNFDYFEENTPENHINAKQTQKNKSIPTKNAFGSSLLQANDSKEKATGPDPANVYASCVGNVIGFEDEGIEVRWVSGLISKVHPHEIFRLHRLDEFVSSPVDGKVVENVQNMMNEHVKLVCHEKKAGNDSTGGFSRRVWNAGISLLPPVAHRFLRDVSERLFKIGGSSMANISHSNFLGKIGECSLSPCSSATRADVLQVNGNVALELHVSVNFPCMDGCQLKLDGLEKFANSEAEEIGGSTFSVGTETPELFKKFDSVSNHLDHHFASVISKSIFTTSQVKSGWLKMVQQEWSVLEKNLPDGIYVRAYEERIDLLRASIIGQRGTPYHHGIFFFDIQLPEDYPQEPPLVHYLSAGLRLNPNLYESGKVCLSLLNTWAGNGTEVWNPKSSNILQVLISLQALVLNDKPYFNEAGYDQQMGRKEADRNSENYNENAFLLTCKLMLYILRQPPKHFEALVLEHFTNQANEILLACKAYMDGAQVGSFGSAQGSKDGCRSSSAGFRIMLAKLFPMLISSFATLGIDCSEFLSQADEVPGFKNGSSN